VSSYDKIRLPDGPAPGASPARYTCTDQQIRMAALDAAARLMAGVEFGGRDTIVRDLEQTVVGMADRFADWIADGTYDWQEG
jgi:hypothetical protein